MTNQSRALDSTETSCDFGQKYTKTNFITRRMIDRFFDVIGDLVRNLDMTSAVEIGCGEGYSTQRLREILPESVRLEASDVERRLIKRARAKNPTIDIRQESIYDLQRGDNSSDIVLALEVLEHLEEPERALAEVFRVSRRWVAFSVPREPAWRVLNMARGAYWRHLGNTPGHVNHWSAREFQVLISRFGRVVRCRTPLPWTIVLAAAAPGV
ncbi:MAG: class I SAM-dependent methyltransferase [Planctomycetota bacterium]|jgi:ubiquinone/menaquinone biosynthesis C-methylase UbiE